jgi:hypothetical protein
MDRYVVVICSGSEIDCRCITDSGSDAVEDLVNDLWEQYQDLDILIEKVWR